jgi:hypothetical protein
VLGFGRAEELLPVTASAEGAEEVSEPWNTPPIKQDVIGFEVTMPASMQCLEATIKAYGLLSHQGTELPSMLTGAFSSVRLARSGALQKACWMRSLKYTEDVTN